MHVRKMHTIALGHPETTKTNTHATAVFIRQSDHVGLYFALLRDTPLAVKL